MPTETKDSTPTVGCADRATYISNAGHVWLSMEHGGRRRWVRAGWVGDELWAPDTDDMSAIEAFDANNPRGTQDDFDEEVDDTPTTTTLAEAKQAIDRAIVNMATKLRGDLDKMTPAQIEGLSATCHSLATSRAALEGCS